MPPIHLPPKVYKTLAPAVKGCIGVAREVKFERLLKVFKRHWGCTVRACKNNAFLVIPPLDKEAWPFAQRTVMLYKPSNARLNWPALRRVRKDLYGGYGWDHQTFVCGSTRP